MLIISPRCVPVVRSLFNLLKRKARYFRMSEIFLTGTALSIEKFPRNSSKFIQYGTAGFRDKAAVLSHVMYRMGLLAVLRSKAKNGQTVGLMITASHNPEEDNGIKLCDPDGKMLDEEWEQLATELVNSEDDTISESLSQIWVKYNIDYNIPATVFLARDTRSSSEQLLKSALEGVQALSGQASNLGLLTTPQLHFVVFCKNYPFYGVPTVEGYYIKLSTAFETLISHGKSKIYVPEVFVDGANGVGACKLKELQPYLKSLKTEIFNDGTKGILNHKCGADFVKIGQRAPEGCGLISGRRYASFDGDADRLVYFYKDKNEEFHLLDGDKIATLFAKFLKDLIEGSGLNLEMRVVQTAYANASSTNYIEKVLGVPVICTPTGVKHLHHEALKHDIGVYFEANGHGTVVFSNDAKLKIRDVASHVNAKADQQTAAKKLLSAIDIVNETVGDALSDLLFTEAILYDKDWNIEDWDALYSDTPYQQLKVTVPDRTAVTTTDAERKCLTPAGLQEEIDSTVSKYRNSRSFIRPSGTEDIIRVYAEADTKEAADKLAEEISQLVKKFTNSS